MNDGSDLFLQLIVMLVFGALLAGLASSKGRNPVGWFFIGAFFFCIGLIILLCLPNLHEEQRRHALQDAQNRRLQEQLRQERLKSQAFQAHTAERLDRHDEVLKIDTRQVATPLIGSTADPARRAPLMAAGEWYYSLAGEKVGPHELNRMIGLIGDGTIRGETLVWDPSRAEWIAASASDSLQSHFW